MAETERTLHDELVTGPPITFAHVGYVGALLLGFSAALDHVLDGPPRNSSHVRRVHARADDRRGKWRRS
jgi:hypothetical protein